MSDASGAGSGRPLAFENEAALQCVVAELIFGDAAELPHALARREVPVGGCIPDLVVVRFAEPPTAAMWPAKRSYRHAFVLGLLRKRDRLHLDTIAARAFEEPERIKPVVDDLVATGALVEADTGAFCLSWGMANIDAEVIAVEAKLRRWRDALDQATQYTGFANRAVVAMDAGGTPNSPYAMAEFRRRGIGLCAVSPGSVEWVVEPRRSPRSRGPEWEYLVSSAAAPRPQTPWSSR